MRAMLVKYIPSWYTSKKEDRGGFFVTVQR